MSQVKRFAVDVSWAFISSVVTLPVLFSIRIVLARWLGASDLGLYQMIVTIHIIATIAATFGIPAAITKFTAESLDNSERLQQVIFSGIICSFVFGSIVALVIYIFSGLLSRLFHMPELTPLLHILAFIFPFTSVFKTIIGILNGLRRMKVYAFLVVMQNTLLIIFTVLLVGLGYGISGAVFGLVLSMVLICGVAIFYTRDIIKVTLYNIIKATRNLLSFGILLLGSNTVNVLSNQVDIVLIGFFLTKEDVGIYSVAVYLSMCLLLVPGAIQRITYPATSEYLSKNNINALHKMLDKSTKYSTSMLLPIGLGIGFFAGEIMTLLFGDNFGPAVLPLQILLIARVIRGGTTAPIGASMTGAGRPGISFGIETFSTISNIFLIILLIPRYGITGAAIGTTVSLLLANGVFLILMPRILKVKIDYIWYAKIFSLAGLSILVFLTASHFINQYVAGTIILCIFSIYILRYALTNEDRSMFKSLLKLAIPGN